MSAAVLELGPWAALKGPAGIVRTRVFIEEQGIAPADEWDDDDLRALHCVVHDAGRPIGTGRLVPGGRIGRMAVLPTARRSGIGGRILEALALAAGHEGWARVTLSAQVRACAFYARHGFADEGDDYLEVGIAHRRMWRMVRRVAIAHDGCVQTMRPSTCSQHPGRT